MNILNLAKKSAKEIFKLIRKNRGVFCPALQFEVKITRRFLQHICFNQDKDRSAEEIMERIVFYIIAMIMITFAVMSVTSRNIMRAIVFLLFVMLGLAGIYFMIDFFFLGAVQLTVYAGGIIILYITSIMLVERIGEPLDASNQVRQWIAGIITTLGAGISLFAIWDYDFTQATESTTTTIKEVGHSLLNYGDGGYILPFEVVSILLLAAMVGAIVIAKSYHKKESSN